jgi:anti-sigma regulatory factor (Ser/Thr protein kinase)
VVADEVADDVVLALSEAATNAVLYGSSGDQPIQVGVHVTHDWVETTVLDHGRSRRPASQQLPTPASCASVGGACGCCAGWWMRYGLSGSSAAPA